MTDKQIPVAGLKRCCQEGESEHANALLSKVEGSSYQIDTFFSDIILVLPCFPCLDYPFSSNMTFSGDRNHVFQLSSFQP